MKSGAAEKAVSRQNEGTQQDFIWEKQLYAMQDTTQYTMRYTRDVFDQGLISFSNSPGI
jgi:hypothetical protein